MQKTIHLCGIFLHALHTHPLFTDKIPISDKTNGKKSCQFDDLLRMTGGFGLYQKILSAFLCLVSVPTGAQMMIQIFYGAFPPFSCVEMFGNETFDQGKCYTKCQKYEFRGPFTSAASEVTVAQCP